MFLHDQRITSLSIPTCWHWLHCLRFTNKTQRKGNYVDRHERSDEVASRKAFCEVYSTNTEPRCLRWIQVSHIELETTCFHESWVWILICLLMPMLVNRLLNFMRTAVLVKKKDNELLVGKNPWTTVNLEVLYPTNVHQNLAKGTKPRDF